MASKAEHINKAEHNESFFQTIIETGYLDWAVNGIFYSALHYLESYLAINDDHPANHPLRNDSIQRDLNLGGRFYSKLYKPLRDDSYEARYEMRVFTREEVRNDIIPLLEAIKTHLEQYVPQIKTV